MLINYHPQRDAWVVFCKAPDASAPDTSRNDPYEYWELGSQGIVSPRGLLAPGRDISETVFALARAGYVTWHAEDRARGRMFAKALDSSAPTR